MGVFIPFNSRDLRHKSIFGSTAAGQSLRFNVVMPRDMGVTGVTLIVGCDGKEDEYVRLDWLSTDGYTEWWGTDYAFREPGTWFYRFNYTTGFGEGGISLHSSGMGHLSNDGRRWQQTVFDPAYETPDSFKGGVMYQIFPDRFAFSGEKKTGVPKDRYIHSDIHETPEFEMNSEFHRWNADFFGGDLKGIEQKLDYLKSLGVTCVYLNPIFEAHSNHRYDTADYMKIDPLLGDESDFRSLCGSAKKKGIRIVIDGVFSHTGADSRYFNACGRYDEIGACQSKSSKYYSWYNFAEDGSYDSWWGFKTLPETNELDESFSDFITGENGVLHKWLGAGAGGVRLDVADELPDVFIEKIRARVKKEDGDNILIGEVWEDASNKLAYHKRRRYLLGDELDSVMNYPFRAAIIDFLTGGSAEDFIDAVVTVCENYPKQTLDCLMNILGTHDTERITSVLGGLSGEGIDRQKQSEMRLDEKKLAEVKPLLECAYTILYTLPGVPCVYYGDELMMQGLKDPFNRCCYDWEETGGVKERLSLLGRLRGELKCLKDGQFACISAMLGCAAYSRESGDEKIITVVNMNEHPITYYLPHSDGGYEAIIGKMSSLCGVEVPAKDAVIVKKL